MPTVCPPALRMSSLNIIPVLDRGVAGQCRAPNTANEHNANFIGQYVILLNRYLLLRMHVYDWFCFAAFAVACAIIPMRNGRCLGTSERAVLGKEALGASQSLFKHQKSLSLYV